MLYPLKFNPIFIEKVWGGKKLQTILNKDIYSEKIGESWEISAIKNKVSVVTNGYYSGKNIQEIINIYKADFLGKKVYDQFGSTFPLLIKFIDACDDLSVQVHPDDIFAQKVHKQNGKNEMWFVVDADLDSELILGVKKTLTKPEFIKSVGEKRLSQILNSEKVTSGDALYIPAGRIHAIMKGVLLAEIQQSSDLTYRIYDWDRKDLNGKFRELHNELAVEVVELKTKGNYFIDYNKLEKFNKLVSNQYFSVNYLQFTDLNKKDYSEIDSFVILMCISGSFSVSYKDEIIDVNKGETILIPAVINTIELSSENHTELLEIYI